MTIEYDVIVVGARCAGAPTAMLLARKGYRVLLVDRATFPSDTISTHIIHPPGVAALARWGLLERVERTGCPRIYQYSFDFGSATISGLLRPSQGTSHALCPRRLGLDAILVEAAVAAGAELHEGCTVDEVLVEHERVTGIRGHLRSGASGTWRARVVVGADGLHSLVARTVQASLYHERPTIAVTYYAYWRGLPTDGLEAFIRPRRGFVMTPTNDGLTMVAVNWPRSEFESNRGDVEGHVARTLALAPGADARARAARRESRFVGTGDLPNFFRKPYGPGWALVGDAGYHKDPISAQGISDAFRDAETLADRLDDVLAARLPFDDAMARYQRARDDAAMPMFELTCQFADLETPPPAHLQQLLEAMRGNHEAMNDFLSMLAGTLSPAAFFGAENVERIMTAARAAP